LERRFFRAGQWWFAAQNRRAGTAVIGPVLLNGPAGLIQVDSGTLRFDEGMVMDGAFTTAAGASVDFHAGSFAYLPPSRFGGTGQYKLTGGR